MEDDLIPDPVKSYKPKQPAIGAQNSGKSQATSIDITDSAALKALAMEALVEIVQTAPRNVSLVSAIRELIDRIEGKAPQSIAMTVKQAPVSLLSDDRLAALLAMCNEPILIPPLPTKE